MKIEKLEKESILEKILKEKFLCLLENGKILHMKKIREKIMTVKDNLIMTSKIIKGRDIKNLQIIEQKKVPKL